ncbi:MAG: DNA mismatch repair protein MutS, partial [Mesorhizobium sp.]
MSKRPDKLSEDDRVLWNLVARTAKPLKGRAAVDIADMAVDARPTPSQPAQPAAGPAGVAKPKVQHVTH